MELFEEESDVPHYGENSKGVAAREKTRRIRKLKGEFTSKRTPPHKSKERRHSRDAPDDFQISDSETEEAPFDSRSQQADREQNGIPALPKSAISQAKPRTLQEDGNRVEESRFITGMEVRVTDKVILEEGDVGHPAANSTHIEEPSQLGFMLPPKDRVLQGEINMMKKSTRSPHVQISVMKGTGDNGVKSSTSNRESSRLKFADSKKRLMFLGSNEENTMDRETNSTNQTNETGTNFFLRMEETDSDEDFDLSKKKSLPQKKLVGLKASTSVTKTSTKENIAATNSQKTNGKKSFFVMEKPVEEASKRNPGKIDSKKKANSSNVLKAVDAKQKEGFSVTYDYNEDELFPTINEKEATPLTDVKYSGNEKVPPASQNDSTPAKKTERRMVQGKINFPLSSQPQSRVSQANEQARNSRMSFQEKSSNTTKGAGLSSKPNAQLVSVSKANDKNISKNFPRPVHEASSSDISDSDFSKVVLPVGRKQTTKKRSFSGRREESSSDTEGASVSHRNVSLGRNSRQKQMSKRQHKNDPEEFSKLDKGAAILKVAMRTKQVMSSGPLKLNKKKSTAEDVQHLKGAQNEKSSAKNTASAKYAPKVAQEEESSDIDEEYKGPLMISEESQRSTLKEHSLNDDNKKNLQEESSDEVEMVDDVIHLDQQPSPRKHELPKEPLPTTIKNGREVKQKAVPSKGSVTRQSSKIQEEFSEDEGCSSKAAPGTNKKALKKASVKNQRKGVEEKVDEDKSCKTLKKSKPNPRRCRLPKKSQLESSLRGNAVKRRMTEETEESPKKAKATKKTQSKIPTRSAAKKAQESQLQNSSSGVESMVSTKSKTTTSNQTNRNRKRGRPAKSNSAKKQAETSLVPVQTAACSDSTNALATDVLTGSAEAISVYSIFEDAMIEYSCGKPLKEDTFHRVRTANGAAAPELYAAHLLSSDTMTLIRVKIPPGEEKALSYAYSATLVCTVIIGNIIAVIGKNKQSYGMGDVFIIPPRNEYNIINDGEFDVIIQIMRCEGLSNFMSK